MDNREIFLSVVSEFPDFKINTKQSTQLSVVLSYKNDIELAVLLAHDDYERNNNMPYFLLMNNEINYPHIMMSDFEYESMSYRYICLYQTNYFIFSDMSFSEKIAFCLERFSKLINLSTIQIEVEYQKEFLFHWNQNVKTFKCYQTLIEDSAQAKYLVVYRNGKSNNLLRISEEETSFNDSKLWNRTENIAVFVPIQDSSGILPHSDGKTWSKKMLDFILNNHEADKISTEVYSLLNTVQVKRQIIIVFSMQIQDRKISFACKLKFGSHKQGFLLDKIETDLIEVENIISKRYNFNYLCEAIGKQNPFIGKNIGIVGVGSLGSYVANELVNAGASKITIYDSDSFEPENLLRHRLSYFDIGHEKAKAMYQQLQSKHPQVLVDYYEENLKSDNISKLVMNNNIQYLIITVGSTDIQTELEKALYNLQQKIVVIYIWLEYDGVNSKVLVTNNSNQSTFYNLITKEPQPVGINEHMMFDGCGGVRVKYGNRTLLSASNALLHAFENMDAIRMPFIISANIVEGLKVKTLGKEIEEYKDKVGPDYEDIQIAKG